MFNSPPKTRAEPAANAASLMRVVAILCCLAAASSLALIGPQCHRPALHTRRAPVPAAQLVRIERPADDGDGGDGGDDGDSEGEEGEDGKILSVSQVADADGSAIPATGRSVASVQFMITRAMRAQLSELGYSTEEVDRMDPPRAATIIAQAVPSSKQPQRGPKRMRDRFELQFTCNVCEAPNSHSISRHAYTKGTVLVTCPGCQSSHLIADNLNWIEDDFKNLEEFMAKRGTPVTRLVADGVAQTAAASALGEAGADLEEEDDEGEDEGEDEAAAPLDPRRPWAGTRPGVKPLDGISDEQARKIRAAVRRRNRPNREDDVDDGIGGASD